MAEEAGFKYGIVMGIARKNWLLRSVGFGFAGFITLEAGGIETAFAQANLPPV
jgi:hypothetical protein